MVFILNRDSKCAIEPVWFVLERKECFASGLSDRELAYLETLNHLMIDFSLCRNWKYKKK